MQREQEGVVKYRVAFERRPWHLSEPRWAAELVAWRQLYLRLGLVGQDPARYEGLGYGNVSRRVPPWSASPGQRRFLVSGSQTGHLERFGPNELALVERYDVRAGELTATGLRAPSSESLSHATLYDLGAHLRWVVHVHCPVLWRAAMERTLQLPCSRPSAAYGSLELVDEIKRLWRDGALATSGLMAMGGHQDGLLAFGVEAAELHARLAERLACAMTQRCLREGELGE